MMDVAERVPREVVKSTSHRLREKRADFLRDARPLVAPNRVVDDLDLPGRGALGQPTLARSDTQESVQPTGGAIVGKHLATEHVAVERAKGQRTGNSDKEREQAGAQVPQVTTQVAAPPPSPSRDVDIDIHDGLRRTVDMDDVVVSAAPRYELFQELCVSSRIDHAIIERVGSNALGVAPTKDQFRITLAERFKPDAARVVHAVLPPSIVSTVPEIFTAAPESR